MLEYQTFKCSPLKLFIDYKEVYPTLLTNPSSPAYRTWFTWQILALARTSPTVKAPQRSRFFEAADLLKFLPLVPRQLQVDISTESPFDETKFHTTNRKHLSWNDVWLGMLEPIVRSFREMVLGRRSGPINTLHGVYRTQECSLCASVLQNFQVERKYSTQAYSRVKALA